MIYRRIQAGKCKQLLRPGEPADVADLSKNHSAIDVTNAGQPGRALFSQEKSKLMHTKGQLSESVMLLFRLHHLRFFPERFTWVMQKPPKQHPVISRCRLFIWRGGLTFHESETLVFQLPMTMVCRDLPFQPFFMAECFCRKRSEYRGKSRYQAANRGT